MSSVNLLLTFKNIYIIIRLGGKLKCFFTISLKDTEETCLDLVSFITSKIIAKYNHE